MGHNIIRKFITLLSLEDDWDSYGARAIEHDSVAMAMKVARKLPMARMVEPSVVPTAKGGVQMEWHRNNVDLEIEIGPDGDIEVAYSIKTDIKNKRLFFIVDDIGKISQLLAEPLSLLGRDKR